MTMPITETLRQASTSGIVQPQLVFEIDGVTQRFGVQAIRRFIEIGDTGLFIDGTWTIGGYELLEDSDPYITLDGTTTSIKQTLEIDKGRGGSISTFQVKVIDFNNEVSNLISPGLVVTDVLGRKCKVYLGVAENTSFPDDYIVIFRGVIDEIIPGPGNVAFNLTHPDKKKQQAIYLKAESKLNGSITNVQTAGITLDAVTDFLSPMNGPSGSPDSSAYYYVLIDDELIRYTGFSGNALTGVSRAQLGTTAAAHDDDSNVVSFYRLTGNCIDLALKIMLSGKNGPYVEDVTITNFGNDGTTTVANTLWFAGVDLEDLYNLQLGDYITTTGASNGANNVTLKEITGVDVRDDGTLLTITGVSFVEELATAGVVDFRSQYDTLGEGLGMDPDEVDIDEHETIKSRYLSDFEYDFYIKEDIEDAKDFLETEIYLPAACYSLPRKARSSMGIFTPPIPGAEIVTVDKTNILNAETIKLKRSINKDFYNTIIYKFDENVLEEKFNRGVITTDATSKARIQVGTKAFTVTSKGMREVLNGVTLATRSIDRKLDIYKYAAESVEGLKVHFGDGFRVEVGDIIIFDPTDLSVTDLATGTRTKGADLYFVKNKTINFKTGEVTLDLLDSGFSNDGRYGLISPASYIVAATSATVFEITSSFASVYGVNEGQKWERFIGETVRVRNTDFTNNSTSTLTNVSGNTITVSPALSFTPSANDILEFAHYNSMSDNVNRVYVFMRDAAPFDDGTELYQMI